MSTVVAFVRLSDLTEADFSRTLARLDEDTRARILSCTNENGRKESLAARLCLSLANAVYQGRFSGGRPLKIDLFSVIEERGDVLAVAVNGCAKGSDNRDFAVGNEAFAAGIEGCVAVNENPAAGIADFVAGNENFSAESAGIPAFLPGSFTRLSSGLFANLSHTDGVAMAAVSDCPVGVDVQTVRAVSAAVKTRVCAETERAEIAASPDPDRAFIGLWTKKESFVKSLGRGIATELAMLNFAAGAPQLTGVRFFCGEVCGAPYAVCLREEK